MEETEEKGAVFETANTISGGKYFGKKNAAKYMLFFLVFSLLFFFFFYGEVTSFKVIEVDKNIYIMFVMEKDLEKDLWVGRKKGILAKCFLTGCV